MSATAILAAAGSGDRLGSEGPKAFVGLAGRPMLEWSLAALDAAESVGEILVAMPPGHEGRLEWPGAREVPGGKSRSESVANAAQHVSTGLVVVHDAARPLATPALFDEVVAALGAEPEAAGVIAATPVTDTTKEVLGGREVHRTLDRSSLWSAQTPQGFRTEALRAALASSELLAHASDDAMLVERRGGRVLVHEAPRENLKVTTPLDLRLAEILLAERG
ncbi:MAG TPA: 2-C-methyl-D-erythritol 4-phosphate cytidylyltransferase [Solirubrobacterales bacterium]